MTNRKLSIAACLLFVVSSSVAIAADDTRAEQQKLIAVLQSNAAPAEKAAACKRLALIGDAEVAPVVAPLLADAKLSSWARIALEAIPGEPCSKVLRDATGQLHGRLLVAAINSLGVRRDVQAVDLLVGRLKDADVDAASAAAVALGHIGGEKAVAALQQSLKADAPELRSAVAEGVILCAERELADNNFSRAAGLYDEVRAADLPQQRVIEATRGAILARGTGGVPMLVEQLRSNDKRFFALGLTVARELSGREVTAALASQVKDAAPERQALLIAALADRNDPNVAALIIQSAREAPEAVRLQALRALKKLDESVTAPVLLEAALAGSPAVSQAMSVIDGLHGDALDRVIADRLPNDHYGHSRLVMIELAGRRHIAAVTPVLWKAVDETDITVRTAALAALGGTIAFDDLPRLAALAAAAKSEDEAGPIAQAVLNASQRMPDREAAAGAIVKSLSKSHVSQAVQCKLLEVLGALGGAKALAVVADAAKSNDELRRDTGYRLLGQWMSTNAAPVLLDLVKNATEDKYKVRAVRAYIRLARQFDMPVAERAQMCRTALGIADRVDDKRLVLEILLRYPSPEMLELAEEAGKTPELKDEAAIVAIGISRGQGDTKELRKALAQAGHKTVKLEILKAVYGEGTHTKDVTKLLRKHAGKYRVIFLPTPTYNEAFGSDPAPGEVKHLSIHYRINGVEGDVSLAENSTILLPVPR